MRLNFSCIRRNASPEAESIAGHSDTKRIPYHCAAAGTAQGGGRAIKDLENVIISVKGS